MKLATNFDRVNILYISIILCATLRRGGQKKVFAVGGYVGTYLNTVEELVEAEESTTWARADSFFGAVAVPEEFICPV